MTLWNKIQKYKKKKCNVCENKFFSPYGFFNDYTGIKCDSCGLVSLLKQPSNDEISNFYNKNYNDNYNNGEGCSSLSIESTNNSRYKRKEKLISKLIKNKNSRILEVGGGMGYFSKYLQESGYLDITMWDINEDSIRNAQSIGINACINNIYTSEDVLDEDKYDMVISWATIEHVTDPNLYFNSLLNHTKKNGYLLLETGIIDTYKDRYSEGISKWFYPPEHLFCFSIRSLLMLANKCQSKRVYINYHANHIRRVANMITFNVRSIIRKQKNMCYDIGILVCKK